MSFIHLHVHSSHSPHDGFSKVEDYFRRAAELGMPALAITDHGSIKGFKEMEAAAKKFPSVRPIYGCEFYVTDHFSHKVRGKEYRKAYHLILLAKNGKGMENLRRLAEIALDEGFYGWPSPYVRSARPRISHELLKKHHEGLICTSACIGGEIPQLLLAGRSDAAEEALNWYKDIFGDDFYLEVSAHCSDIPGFKTDVYEQQCRANAAIFELAARTGVKVVASNDVHFLRREDGPAHDVRMSARYGKRLDDPKRIRYSQQEYFKTEDEMRAVFPDHPEALENTLEILAKIENELTILQRMDKVISTVIEMDEKRNTRLMEEKIPEVEGDLKILGGQFGISPKQALLFVLLFESCNGRTTDIEDLSRYLSVSRAKAISYIIDIGELKKKWLIKEYKNGDYSIPRKVQEALKQNTAYIRPDFKGNDIKSMVFQISDLMTERKYYVFSDHELAGDFHDIIMDNPDNSLSRYYRTYIRDLTSGEIVLFFYMLRDRIVFSNDAFCLNDLSDNLNPNSLSLLRSHLRSEVTDLQKQGIIGYDSSSGITTKEDFRFNDEELRKMFSDAPEMLVVNMSEMAVIKPSGIVAKSLYFNDKINDELRTLANLLREENYLNLKRSLRSNGMREGFTCLFYGGPGTGKTESVYQLAKESGRELYEVDVAKVKNLFVGESEKNMRRVFSAYRSAAASGGKTPILLFNEADAILGKRMTGAEHSVDKMNNAIQNIILQEMEKLDGIMIATTNLTENLDSAFERRFLYKLRFENPTSEIRGKIWSDMMPELSSEEVKVLSNSYEFSGGQIENISRKKFIANLLSGQPVTFEQIVGFCKEESLQDRNNRPRIGF